MPDALDEYSELLASLCRLEDDELVARLKSLTARERQATALLVAHLAELDTRDVYLKAGYSSVFTYCRDFLAFSDDEAYNRVVAARTARRFPAILDLLAAGELNVTTVRLLAAHLTPENHLALLADARGKRKAEVEEIVARLSPRPDVRASVRKLPQNKTASLAVVSCEPSTHVAGLDREAVLLVSSQTCSPSVSVPAGVAALGTPALPATFGTLANAAVDRAEAESLRLPRPQRPAAITPLSPDRYRYQLTIGGATLDKLRLAKDMLRHALPSGDDEAILDRALTALLADLARRRFGADRRNDPDRTSGQSTSCCGGTGSTRRGAESPCNAPAGSGAAGSGAVGSAAVASDAVGSSEVTAADSRYIPVAVKRAVWVRDLGRCTFVGTDGRRCNERGFLQFHHVRPYANGGEPTVENTQLRCGPHNRYEARRYFAREGGVDDHAIANAEPGCSEDRSRAVPERSVARKAARPSKWESQALVLGV